MGSSSPTGYFRAGLTGLKPTRRGFAGLRVTGNASLLEKPDWHGFMEYEATVDAIFEQHRILAICTYSLSRCGALQIMDVISNHAFALVKRADKWEVIQSAERKKAEASVRESEARFHALVTATSDAVYRMSPDWTEMRYLRGKDFIPDSEWPSCAWLQKYVHPEDQQQVMAAINRARRSMPVGIRLMMKVYLHCIDGLVAVSRCSRADRGRRLGRNENRALTTFDDSQRFV